MDAYLLMGMTLGLILFIVLFIMLIPKMNKYFIKEVSLGNMDKDVAMYLIKLNFEYDYENEYFIKHFRFPLSNGEIIHESLKFPTDQPFTMKDINNNFKEWMHVLINHLDKV